jgi:hypothetical protein
MKADFSVTSVDDEKNLNTSYQSGMGAISHKSQIPTPMKTKRQGIAARLESLLTHVIGNLLVMFQIRAKTHAPASTTTI